MAHDIINFVGQLTAVRRTSGMHNPYHEPLLAKNLAHYLRLMRRETEPWLLLVGEALGYRGGLLTGVPFTSEKLLHTAVCETLPILSQGRWHCLPEAQTRPWTGEQSATIVWHTIRQLGQEGYAVPLLWNAYPFHPYQRYRPRSNRAPTAGELAQGQAFLSGLMGLFEIECVTAVGNQASKSLAQMGLAHEKIRHPAHGGKKAFVHGLRQLVGA